MWTDPCRIPEVLRPKTRPSIAQLIPQLPAQAFTYPMGKQILVACQQMRAVKVSPVSFLEHEQFQWLLCFYGDVGRVTGPSKHCHWAVRVQSVALLLGLMPETKNLFVSWYQFWHICQYPL